MQFGLFVAICSGLFASSRGFFGGWSNKAGCYILLAQKLRHRDFLIDKKISVRSLYDCKKECDITFMNCRSFSYNTNFDKRFDDNCLLSNREPGSLDLREGSDLDFERDYVFYGKFAEPRCQSAYASLRTPLNTIQYNGAFGTPTNSVSSCFHLAKRGVRIANMFIRQTLPVLTVAECEQSCLRAAFFCRGFNFKYKADRIRYTGDNCELSAQDTYRLNTDDENNFIDDYGSDFYERDTSSSNCGMMQYTMNYPHVYGRQHGWQIPISHNNLGGNFVGGYGTDSRLPNSNSCFSLRQRYSRPDMRFVMEKKFTRSLDDCKRRCMEHSSCKSFAYRYDNSHGQWHGNNCYLCDFQVDYMNSRYDMIPDQEFNLYQRESAGIGRNCNNFGLSSGEGRSNPYAPEGGFQTVSGLPCHRDRCREDVDGKYYFCDTDNAGSWDYCCRPDEVCPIHASASTTWCHVGSRKKDQWRPCKSTGIRRSFLMETGTYPNNTFLALPSAGKTASYKGSHPLELKDLNSII